MSTLPNTPIPGTWNLADITAAIRGKEVSRVHFTDSAIDGDDNSVSFDFGRPDGDALLVWADSDPPGADACEWEGEMNVEGERRDVCLYRVPRQTFAAVGDVSGVVGQIQQRLGLVADSHPGPKTWAALAEQLLPANEMAQVMSQERQANERSEKVIATLLPHVRPYARALYFKAADHGITINIISGLRTYEEQNALYAQGRTKPGKIVTNARGGYSNHNFGIAFDVGVFEGRKYLGESPKYKAVGVLGQEIGLEWGGNWKNLRDEPHFQLRPAWARGMREKDMLAEMRRRKDDGTSIA